MTILLSADCMGGVWTYSLDLARALPQHNFLIATMGDLPSKSQQSALARLHNAQLRVSGWKLEWMDSPWDDVARAGDWLLDLEREWAPDIVQLGGFCHANCAFKAPKIVVAHSCVCSWWRAVKGENAPREWDVYRAQVGAGLCAAARVVAPTRAILAEMQAIYGPFAPAQVIWNGAASPSTLHEEKESFVLGAGRLWDEAKNVGLLARIAPQISAPIRVAGAGAGDDSRTAAPNLELLGFLESDVLETQMRSAAIWAHPARYEPFGLATLEAALRGCALVLSDIPTLRELWDGAALFAAPDDDQSWKNALQGLLDSPQTRIEWAAKARARAACYSLELVGARYDALYQELKST